jgi:hypothetical protein
VRGRAHDPVLRAKLMAQHEAGVPPGVLSAQHGIARPRLSRRWKRCQAADMAGLQPRSRRPHRLPRRHSATVTEAIDLARDFEVGRLADRARTWRGPTTSRPTSSSNSPPTPRNSQRLAHSMRKHKRPCVPLLLREVEGLLSRHRDAPAVVIGHPTRRGYLPRLSRAGDHNAA